MVSAGALVLMFAAAPAAALTSPTISEMVEMIDISSVAVSPDGNTVAFRTEQASVADNLYRLGWYVVPADGAAPPRRIAGAGEGDWPDGTIFSEPPVWTKDSSAIVYRKIEGGEIQIWRSSVDGARSEKLTSDPANVQSFALSKDNRTLTYAVGASRSEIEQAEEAEYQAGVLIDSKVDPLRQLFRGTRIEGRLATDRLHGFWFAHGGVLAGRPPAYRSLELASRNVRNATAAETAGLAKPAKPFDKLGDHTIMFKAESGDRRGDAFLLGNGTDILLAVRRPEPDGKMITCDQPLCKQRISKVSWQGDADGLLFVTTDLAAEQTLYLWSVDAGTVRRVGGGDGRWNGGRDEKKSCSVARQAAFCVRASADGPPDLVRVDLATGKVRILAAPNQRLDRADFLKFEPLEWTAPTGQRFTGKLLRPAHAGPSPLFVTYYVCDGYLRGGTGDEFPLRQLAASGIAVLCINRVPTAAGLGDQVEQYRIAETGVGSAIDLLAHRGIVDPAHVGMGGISFGGEATMWIATRTSRLAALSIGNAVLSHAYYWFGAMAGREVPEMLRQVWGVGAPEQSPERWKLLAPELMTGAIEAPLLMQLPEHEFRANMELAARLSQAGKPVEFRAFPYETHIKFQPRHKRAIYERNLDWFRFWLQGYVDPNPAKDDQYRRWNAMKASKSR